MDTRESTQAEEYGSMATGEARIHRIDEIENTENRTTAATTGDIKLNEIAAGALCKTADTAAAITLFAVNVPIGIGIVTLGSVGKWIVDGTEGINTQFSTLVNRVFRVKG